MNRLKQLLRRLITDSKRICLERPKVVGLAAVLLLLVAVYGISKAAEGVKKVIHVERDGEFKGERILGDASTSVNEAKERSFAKTAGELIAGQQKMTDELKKLSAKVEAIEGKSKDTTGQEPATPGEADLAESREATDEGTSTPGVTMRPPAESYGTTRVGPDAHAPGGGGYGQSVGVAPVQRRSARGPAVISFPVKDEAAKEEVGIVLPPGSYVKAKLLTGVEAPEGRPYPVLLQLDFANILPNQHKLDLSGCFMIIKAQGDLSTERVQMQATKLSCVGKTGRMFEKDINGFVVDDKDNSFAISGEVNSKQDRVAAMAFLSSVVEGVGKAIQEAQTTQQTTPLGGSQSVLTGDEKKYMLAGGASNAAGVVTQWYLKQAENLLPTIKVGSGADVWVVMQESVNLPKFYFKKGAGNEARYAYVTRIVD